MWKGSEVALSEAADWYASLAKKPGWWDYCRQAVKELEADESGLYKGLRLAVRERVEARPVDLQSDSNGKGVLNG